MTSRALYGALATPLATLALTACSVTIDLKSLASERDDIQKCVATVDSRGRCAVGTEGNAPVALHGEYWGALDALSAEDTSKMYAALTGPRDQRDGSSDKGTLNEEGREDIQSEITESLRVSKEHKGRFNALFFTMGCYEPYNKAGVEPVRALLETDTRVNLHGLIRAQLGDGGATPQFDRDAFAEFSNDLGDAYRFRYLQPAACHSLMAALAADDGDKQVKLLTVAQELSYVKDYLDAYFRSGDFIVLTYEGNDEVTDLYNRIKGEIRDTAGFLTDEETTRLADNWFKRFAGRSLEECKNDPECEVRISGELSDKKFVSRGGRAFGFPHTTVSIESLTDSAVEVTDIDWTEVGAEIVMVYIEAVGDRILGIPAAPGSTACALDDRLCYKEGNDYDVTSAEFGAVNDFAVRAQAIVTNATGKAVRGIGPLSLDNEAIARIIEVSLGTIAKKAAEKVAFCAYSCVETDGKAPLRAVTDPFAFSAPGTTIQETPVTINW